MTSGGDFKRRVSFQTDPAFLLWRSPLAMRTCGLVSAVRFPLTLTLSRGEREQPLVTSIFAGDCPANPALVFAGDGGGFSLSRGRGLG